MEPSPPDGPDPNLHVQNQNPSPSQNPTTINDYPQNSSLASLQSHPSVKHKRAMDRFRAVVMRIADSSTANGSMTAAQKGLIERRLNEFLSDFRTPNHPPYHAMILGAIKELNEEMGSTESSISNFIKAKYNDLPWAHFTVLKHHLGKLCDYGEIMVTRGQHYLLAGANLDSDSSRKPRRQKLKRQWRSKCGKGGRRKRPKKNETKEENQQKEQPEVNKEQNECDREFDEMSRKQDERINCEVQVIEQQSLVPEHFIEEIAEQKGDKCQNQVIGNESEQLNKAQNEAHKAEYSSCTPVRDSSLHLEQLENGNNSESRSPEVPPGFDLTPQDTFRVESDRYVIQNPYESTGKCIFHDLHKDQLEEVATCLYPQQLSSTTGLTIENLYEPATKSSVLMALHRKQCAVPPDVEYTEKDEMGCTVHHLIKLHRQHGRKCCPGHRRHKCKQATSPTKMEASTLKQPELGNLENLTEEKITEAQLLEKQKKQEHTGHEQPSEPPNPGEPSQIEPLSREQRQQANQHSRGKQLSSLLEEMAPQCGFKYLEQAGKDLVLALPVPQKSSKQKIAKMEHPSKEKKRKTDISNKRKQWKLHLNEEITQDVSMNSKQAEQEQVSALANPGRPSKDQEPQQAMVYREGDAGDFQQGTTMAVDLPVNSVQHQGEEKFDSVVPDKRIELQPASIDQSSQTERMQRQQRHWSQRLPQSKPFVAEGQSLSRDQHLLPTKHSKLRRSPELNRTPVNESNKAMELQEQSLSNQKTEQSSRPMQLVQQRKVSQEKLPHNDLPPRRFESDLVNAACAAALLPTQHQIKERQRQQSGKWRGRGCPPKLNSETAVKKLTESGQKNQDKQDKPAKRRGRPPNAKVETIAAEEVLLLPDSADNAHREQQEAKQPKCRGCGRPPKLKLQTVMAEEALLPPNYACNRSEQQQEKQGKRRGRPPKAKPAIGSSIKKVAVKRGQRGKQKQPKFHAKGRP